jgi:hypothetical protein
MVTTEDFRTIRPVCIILPIAIRLLAQSGYGLDDRGSFPSNAGFFLFATTTSLALETNRLCIRCDGGIPTGVKQLAREADHSPPCSAEVKNE